MTDLFSGIGDAIGDAAGAIGGAASTAFDFLTPTTDRRGAGFSFSDLVNTAGDVVRNSMVGAIGSFDDVLRSDASWKEKLFTGGMIGLGLGGAALGARQLAAQRKIERQFAAPHMVSRTSDRALGLGLQPRWRAASPESAMVVKQHPGIRARSVDVLAAQDAASTALALVEPHVPKNLQSIGRATTIVESYVERLEELAPEARLGAAQLDFAKVDTIVDTGLMRVLVDDREGKGAGYLNADLEQLWNRFKSAPESLTDDDAERLVGFVRQIGEATSMVSEPDLTFNVVDRVSGVYLTDQGVVLSIESPVWDRLQTMLDPAVRSARLRQMNVRALAGRGKEIFERLLDMGLEDTKLRAEGKPGILPKKLDIGPGWYPIAGGQIDEALVGVQARIPWLSKEKLTAAVSLTSEAEKWEGNIALAVRALEVANTPEVMDPEFQAWLRAGGASDNDLDRPDLAARIRELHDEAKKGNQLSESDFAKVLRLASEDPDALFATTHGRKQKSFYLNLLGDRSVVTVDRHQHDAFFGVATSSDFKILEQSDLDDSVYDLIQDVVFQIADERPELTPSDVQGVIWEVWRILKDNHLHFANKPWQIGNPFRVMEADGSENIVFEALMGEYSGGLRDALAAKGPSIPYMLGPAKDGLYSMPDETVGFVGRVDADTAVKLRHLQPAIAERSGVAHWAPSRPRRVMDLESHLRRLDEQMGNHIVETWQNDVWPGGHPALLPGDTIMVELPAGMNTGKLQKFGSIVKPLGPGRRSQPSWARDVRPPSGVRTVTIDEFVKARQRWEKRMAKEGKLRDFGTSPLPDDLTEWKDHRLYLTEDGKAGFAIAPDGDLQQVFSGGAPGLGAELVEYAISQGATKLDAYDAGLPEYYKQFGFEEYDRWKWDPKEDHLNRPTGPEISLMRLDPSAARSTLRTNKVAIKVDPKNARNIAAFADEIEQLGYKVDAVYTGQRPPQGWGLAREHVIQDGVNTALVRTADGELDSYHGVHAWVRQSQAKRLERKNPDGRRARKAEPQLNDDGTILFDGVVALRPVRMPEKQYKSVLDFLKKDRPDPGQRHVLTLDNSGPIPAIQSVPIAADADPEFATFAEVVDGRILINAQPLGGKGNVAQQTFDLQEASEIRDAFLEMGVSPESIEIRVGRESIGTELYRPQTIKGESTTIHGYHVPELKRTGTPLPEFRERFKLDVDPAWRDQDGTIHRVDQSFFEPMRPILERFYADHLEMARVADFRRIGISSQMPDKKWDPQKVGAWATHGEGGSVIGFNGRFVEDLASYYKGVEPGYFSIDTRDAGALVAHELGHVMHTAVRKSFRTKDEADAWDKDVLQALKKQFKKKEIQSYLSTYASTNLLEFVAEACGEVLAKGSSARPMAKKVYTLVVDQFRENVTFKERTTRWRMTG